MPYHIRHQGRKHGPLSEAQLTTLLSRGTITHETEATVDEIHWQALGDFPEVKRILARLPLEAPESPAAPEQKPGSKSEVRFRRKPTPPPVNLDSKGKELAEDNATTKTYVRLPESVQEPDPAEDPLPDIFANEIMELITHIGHNGTRSLRYDVLITFGLTLGFVLILVGYIIGINSDPNRTLINPGSVQNEPDRKEESNLIFEKAQNKPVPPPINDTVEETRPPLTAPPVEPIEDLTDFAGPKERTNGLTSADFSPNDKLIPPENDDETTTTLDSTLEEIPENENSDDLPLDTASKAEPASLVDTSETVATLPKPAKEAPEQKGPFKAKTDCSFIELKHKGRVDSVIFSPDGSKIATAGFDKIARIWDAKSGKEFRILEHSSSIISIIFSPDGNKIITVDGDYRNIGVHNGKVYIAPVHIWDIKSGKAKKFDTVPSW